MPICDEFEHSRYIEQVFLACTYVYSCCAATVHTSTSSSADAAAHDAVAILDIRMD